MSDSQMQVSNIGAADDIIVSVRDLAKRYKVGGQVANALNGVSFDIRRGEFVAIVGASGSGKSTLLNMIGGLDRPTAGSITIDGVELGSISDRKLSIFRNQMIGFVFQFFYLQPFLNVMRNVEIAAMPGRVPKRERHQAAVALIDRVGMTSVIKHLPNQLSGGQIQRVAIARALINHPAIILADEPTGNLDSENSRAIMALFNQLRQEFGTTIIVTTHDPAIAASADRVITIKDGVNL